LKMEKEKIGHKTNHLVIFKIYTKLEEMVYKAIWNKVHLKSVVRIQSY